MFEYERAKKTKEKPACFPVFADHSPTNCSKQVSVNLPSAAPGDPVLPLPRGNSPLPKQHHGGISASELATQGSAGQKMLAEIPHFPFDFRHPKRWEKHNSSASLPVLLSWMGKRPSRTAGLPLVGKSISEGVDMLINTSLSLRLIPLVSEHLH